MLTFTIYNFWWSKRLGKERFAGLFVGNNSYVGRRWVVWLL